MSIDQYSTTPSNNDLANYFKTGMRPSQVKTAGWDIMADLASYAVSLPTAGGSANALTVTNGRPFGALVAGLLQILNPAADSTGPATFSPDGLTAAAIYANGLPLAGGELQAGVPAFLKFDGTQWNLLNPAPPGRNFMVDPCCRVAQGGPAMLSTARQYGAVDLTQCWASGTAVSAGSITQDTAYTVSGAATAYSCKLGGCTITGTGKVFFRRWIESRDAIALKNRNVLFSVLGFQDTGGNINAFLTVNKATAQDNFAGVTNIATGTAVSLPTNSSTAVTAAAAMGDCSNGVEIILEMDCGAVTTKDFYATDWQVCIGTLAQVCGVPRFLDELQAAKRWFERSWSYGSLTGATGFPGQKTAHMPVGVPGGNGINEMDVYFEVEKCSVPTVIIYSEATGAIGKIRDATTGTDIAAAVGVLATTMFEPSNAGGSMIAAGDLLRMHWTADARL